MSVIYKTVPEYQPSSAQITLGDPFYKTSGGKQNVTVTRVGVDVVPLALVGIPIGVVALWVLSRRKKRKKKKRKKS